MSDDLLGFSANPPPKPWERTGSSSGPAPFKPPSSGSTSDVVEASGTANPGEVVPASGTAMAGSVVPNQNIVGRPLPPRPWQQNTGSTYGGYGSNLNYNTGYGSGMYGSYGGGLYRNTYGGGMYNSMSSGYGGTYGGTGMYGGGMYNSGFGGPMGGYGMGFGGGPYNQDPNDPNGAPASPPGFWISFLRVMHGVVDFFGKISVLIDQNTQAFHMFMTALLQIFDRSGMLYGEIARFVLRVLGIRRPRKPQLQPGPNGLPMGNQQLLLGGPKAASESWDGVWGK